MTDSQKRTQPENSESTCDAAAKDAETAAQKAPESQGSSSINAGAEDSRTQPLPESMPPASFSSLVSMLALQAAVALGQLPDPEQGRPVVRPDVARHFIDFLGMLEEKTEGNLTDEEQRLLGNALADLRLAFVSVQAKRESGAK